MPIFVIVMKDIYLITENVPNSTEIVFVRATESEIEKRKYLGGFMRFNSELFDYWVNCPRGMKIDGKPILSIEQFDEWRKQHFCD